MKLLLRCRRIILQDAATFLILGKENSLVNTRPSANNLFLSEEFRSFQEQVKVAISTPVNDRLQEFENVFPHLVDSQNEVSSRIAGFDQQLNFGHRKLQEEIVGLKQQVIIDHQVDVSLYVFKVISLNKHKDQKKFEL